MAKNTEKNAKDYNLRAREKYQRDRTRRVTISFNVDTEADVIAHLERQERMGTYIKGLILKDMNK